MLGIVKPSNAVPQEVELIAYPDGMPIGYERIFLLVATEGVTLPSMLWVLPVSSEAIKTPLIATP